MLEVIQKQIQSATMELLELAKVSKGAILIVGCSSSEVTGHKIGSHSSMEVAKALFDGMYPILQQHEIYLAAQCCEHLNRAIIIEKEVARRERLEQVHVVPQSKAGGSFATIVYQSLSCPVVVEEIKADCGMDIGNTLIGMHLKKVAVPVRLSICKIGEASLTCARTRLKFIGGERACYDIERTF